MTCRVMVEGLLWRVIGALFVGLVVYAVLRFDRGASDGHGQERLHATRPDEPADEELSERHGC